MLLYIGPGAGFAFFSTAFLFIISGIILLLGFVLVPFRWFRNFFSKIIPSAKFRYLVYLLVAGLILWGGYAGISSWLSGPEKPRLVVLGMDGIDPGLVNELIERRDLPNFEKLKEQGSLQKLRVPNPPISPASWTSFVTGKNPGKHGVLGFIGRDKETYQPELFTRVEDARGHLGLPPAINIPGPYKIPLFPPEVNSKRQGKAFWEYVSEQGIQSSVVRVPVTFPPEELDGYLISGLGTPDLRGTQGEYSQWVESVTGGEASSGTIRELNFINSSARSEIVGPENTLLDSPRPVETPVEFIRREDELEVKIDSSEGFTLGKNEWSGWKKINFSLGLGMNVSGIARFHLNSLEPFDLYMTPIQINPGDPALQISYPSDYAGRLQDLFGYFYTMGMAQDDKALQDGIISDRTFVEQSYQGMRERRKMLRHELQRSSSRLVVAEFDVTDRIQHMFWRFRDPEHPLYDAEKAKQFNHVIPRLYKKMDEILGEVLNTVDSKTPVIVVSDHGFTTFRRQFHINDWLVENGYMEVKDNLYAEKGKFLRTKRGEFFVDWSRTKAYQVGLGGIYINVEGREGQGSVKPENKWKVAQEIKDKLSKERDPKTGEKIFDRIYLAKNLYEGLYWQDGPDLILGFNSGYRTSWASAGGTLEEEKIVTDNLNKWSGTHIVEAAQVPGILATNVPVSKKAPAFVDVAPTVLDYYDIDIPVDFDGSSLFEREPEE
ncbi:MAG: alkaline phosphatase family protein [bacterium]